MAIIVALKQNGKVYLGCAKNGMHNDVRQLDTNVNSIELFKVKGMDNMVIGVSDTPAESCILKYADLIPKDEANHDIDMEYMVNKFVPRVFKILEDRKMIISTKDGIPAMRCGLTVGYKDKLFRVFQDGCVVEYNNFVADGSSEDVAFASLLITKDIDDPVERIKEALLDCRTNNIMVDYPFYITDTDKCEIKVIDAEDKEELR